MVSAKLILIGETGVGKSNLGNFILEKQVFKVSDDPNSETKITQGDHGDGERSDIFVIDTPGLQDAQGTDKEHLTQMIDYIKANPGLQGIVVVINYQQPRLALHIKTILQILCNVFPSSSFWSHVAIVWTKFFYYLPPNMKNKRETTSSKYAQEILELVRSANGDSSIQSFPTFFVDTDFNRKDPDTCVEINKLIDWVSKLSPVDVTKIRHADTEIKETSKETDIRETKRTVKNIEYIKKEYYERDKKIRYDGNVLYSDWRKVKEITIENKLPRKLINTTIEEKEESWTPPHGCHGPPPGHHGPPPHGCHGPPPGHHGPPPHGCHGPPPGHHGPPPHGCHGPPPHGCHGPPPHGCRPPPPGHHGWRPPPPGCHPHGPPPKIHYERTIKNF
ncbi:P-loop containing nucleoside triphosphate hydrolase protein [Neocallimastix lanati (nom. inval.)]|nr:P-loop containing nucleoside triphosphate hydrolase protein [Neocallimastix sp. JGI-2020a]